MTKVIFRVDASKKIGFGHLTRCLKIAKFFSKKKVIFVLSNSNYEAEKILISQKYFYYKIFSKKIKQFDKVEKKSSQIIDAYKTIDIAKKENVKIIIQDDYNKNYFWQKEIISKNLKLVVIDDLNDKKMLSDIYINFNISRKKINHKICIAKKYLCGHNYNPFLSKRFQKNYDNSIKKVHFCLSSSVPKIFVENILKALNEKFKKKIKVYLYCLDYSFEKIQKKKYVNLNLKFFKNSKYYLKNIQTSEIGIGFCGLSMFDRISHQLPSINFSVSQNQSLSLKDQYLRKFFYPSFAEKNNYNQIKKDMDNFIDHEDIRFKIYKNCNKLVFKSNFNIKKNIINLINES